MSFSEEILEVPQELVCFIETGSKFIIAGHKEPDGDCVGSQLALRSALIRLGKEAVVCSAGPFERTELKNYKDQFKDLCEAETKDAKVIILDCAGIERTGSIQELLEKFPCAVIDHHVSFKHPPSTEQAPFYVDSNAPACTLLIYRLITALGLEISKEEADLLFFGLSTDTGFFRFLDETDASVFDFAAALVRRGVNPKKIYNTISGGRSYNSRVLLGNILSRIESYFEEKLVLSYETFEECQKYGFKNRDSESLYQLLLSIDKVEAVVMIRQELADTCTVSLRSVDKINVAKIAVSFGGGGHKNAAGLTIKGDISYVKQVILNSLKDSFI